MYDANALQDAIVATLAGYIPGDVYDRVPVDAKRPYTVVGEVTEAPDDLHDREGSEVTAMLHTWSDQGGMMETNALLAEIDARLHRAPPVLAAGRVWMAVREFTDVMRDRDPKTGGEVRHGVARYRFRMEEV